VFELFVALKYLIPRKKLLSTSLISLMSILVISLVVWLVVVFLSVTTGIEKNWLKKLTTLNAPIRIYPTKNYYSSYYYQIDNLSISSNYSYKSINEKAFSRYSDPYNPDTDMEVPHYWPKPEKSNGKLLDPVKELYGVLNNKKITYQDYEISGALLRVALNRNALGNQNKVNYMTQMSYMMSYCENNPHFDSLISPVNERDLNNVLKSIYQPIYEETNDIPQNASFLSQVDMEKKIKSLFSNIEIEKIKTKRTLKFPIALLSKDKSYDASGLFYENKMLKLSLGKNNPQDEAKGEVFYKDGKYHFKYGDKIISLTNEDTFYLNNSIILDAHLIEESVKSSKKISDILLRVENQDLEIKGTINFKNIYFYKAKTKSNISNTTPPLWIHKVKDQYQLSENFQKEKGILLPKASKDSGILVGDRGYLAYAIASATSTQEMRIPVYVSGFYDPGILPVGSRFLIVPQEIASTINLASTTFCPDGSPTNAIYVWTKDLSRVNLIKEDIERTLEQKNISKYWRVETYRDYEFSKDLLEQFQSDRTLFTLIAIIIIIVACCNIISLLVLLVNDKKKEIATLIAMGASKTNISIIFGICGIVTGLVSSCIGTISAIFTLRHLDVLVSLLSKIQGHNAFNPAFFGKTLPNQLSMEALIFVLIATPLISLIAGLIPAIKASTIKPSNILRSQ
jgi:lipoprotein-releasing system permease protein